MAPLQLPVSQSTSHKIFTLIKRMFALHRQNHSSNSSNADAAPKQLHQGDLFLQMSMSAESAAMHIVSGFSIVAPSLLEVIKTNDAATDPMLTPPIPSSSPMPEGDAMDCSPLPHKPAFSTKVQVAMLPTPDPTPPIDEGSFTSQPFAAGRQEQVDSSPRQ